jgi:hypothetical protein
MKQTLHCVLWTVFFVVLILGIVNCVYASPSYGDPGNLLISDQFNNRVIEVDPQTGVIIWQYGNGPNDFSDNSPLGVNDAQKVGEYNLITATGIPPGVVDACDPDGCLDSRVILVNQEGIILWSYGTFGVVGFAPNQLNFPVQATYLPSGHVLITDQSNERVIEVETNHNTIVWQYGSNGIAGDSAGLLNSPNSAELLRNGNILIADEGNNRVIEVNRNKDIVQTFTIGGSSVAPAFASRLNNGNTLITDGGNSRVVEVDANDNIIWQYVTNTNPDSNPSPSPSRGIRLANGITVISDQYNDRVIYVDRSGNIIHQFGNLNQVGYGTTSTMMGLNAPYDAKVNCDYNGITNPQVGCRHS